MKKLGPIFLFFPLNASGVRVMCTQESFSCFLSMNGRYLEKVPIYCMEKANSVILAVDQIDPGSVPRRENVRKDSVTANPYGNMGPEVDRGMGGQLLDPAMGEIY